MITDEAISDAFKILHDQVRAEPPWDQQAWDAAWSLIYDAIDAGRIRVEFTDEGILLQMIHGGTKSHDQGSARA